MSNSCCITYPTEVERLSKLTGLALTILLFGAFVPGCRQVGSPAAEPFYSQSDPPAVQEFRWSNGRRPKSFDPARAASPPETDVVRALYEGLTDIDPKSLKEVPGIAERWESSPDLRVWTFHLRKDAKWANGEAVNAEDFVISWKRLVKLREKAANSYLYQNIAGMRAFAAAAREGQPPDFVHETLPTATPPLQSTPVPANPASRTSPPHPELSPAATADKETESGRTGKKPVEPEFGAVAVDDRTLRVTLISPDKDLPKLVANPVFRPIYGDGVEFEDDGLDADLVTSGPFKIAGIDDRGISLERSDTYWNRKTIALERVRFVASESAETALEAYRAGAVDAVTNANFEPLTVKLLSPYEDFRRTPHSSLNFYEINERNAPFSDRRVREALAVSIDREKLTEGELEGSTQPAYSFLPLGPAGGHTFAYDVERAKDDLAKAGYPNGAGFPVIRLVVNRNDTQQRVARTVARMWKQALNLDTHIIVKEPSEIEKVRSDGDYDVLRRGTVMPTTDEQVSLGSVLTRPADPETMAARPARRDDRSPEIHGERLPGAEVSAERSQTPGQIIAGSTPAKVEPRPEPTLSQDDAIFEVRAIPLYSPAAYSLVRPYVRNFETNGLDSPSLKDVVIDLEWRP